jgi:hypothetical protein
VLRSVFAGLGIADLLEGLGVVGGVHFLLGLVDRIDLVAAAFELDLADGESLGVSCASNADLGLNFAAGAVLQVESAMAGAEIRRARAVRANARYMGELLCCEMTEVP